MKHKPLFEVINGKPEPTLSGKADGKTILTVAQAAKRFNKSPEVLAQDFWSTFDQVIPRPKRKAPRPAMKPRPRYLFEVINDDRALPIPYIDVHGEAPKVDGKTILTVAQAAKRDGRSRAQLAAEWRKAWGRALPLPAGDEETWPGQVWQGRFPFQPPRSGFIVIAARGRPDEILAVLPYGPGDQSRRNALQLGRRVARDPKRHRLEFGVNLRHVSMEGRPMPPWVYALQLRPLGKRNAHPIHPVPFCPYRFLFMLAQHVRIPGGIGIGRSGWEEEFTGYDGMAAQVRRDFEPGHGTDEDRWTARGRKRRRELLRKLARLDGSERRRRPARRKGGRQ